MQKNGDVLPGNIFVSRPGKLKYTRLIHLSTIDRTFEHRFKTDIVFDGVAECMRTAEREGCRNVGFPASETLMMNPNLLQTMFEGIVDWCCKNQPLKLIAIYLVDSNTEMIEHVHRTAVAMSHEGLLTRYSLPTADPHYMGTSNPDASPFRSPTPDFGRCNQWESACFNPCSLPAYVQIENFSLFSEMPLDKKPTAVTFKPVPGTKHRAVTANDSVTVSVVDGSIAKQKVGNSSFDSQELLLKDI